MALITNDNKKHMLRLYMDDTRTFGVTILTDNPRPIPPYEIRHLGRSNSELSCLVKNIRWSVKIMGMKKSRKQIKADAVQCLNELKRRKNQHILS